MAEISVFGYGSLVHREALEAFLGHPLAPGDFGVATLTGYRRGWNVARDNRRGDDHRTYVHPDGTRHEGTVTVLGVTPSAPHTVNGVVFGVDAEDLGRVDRREAMYERVDVTAAIVGCEVPAATVVTYVPRDEHRRIHRAGVSAGVDAISAGYVDLVSEGFAGIGAVDEYRASTDPIPSPVVPILRRDQRPPAT